MLGDKLDAGERPIDVPRMIQAARTGAKSLVALLEKGLSSDALYHSAPTA
jgi:hypothetical protein